METADLQSGTVRRFVDALHAVEQHRDVTPLAELVADGAEVRSIDGHGARRGPDGMGALFTQYLAQFARVETTFTRVTESAGRAALEWRSDAVLATGGAEVTYTGVTVVETEGEQVTDFGTVYDSGALLRPGPRGEETSGGGPGPSGSGDGVGGAGGAGTAGGGSVATDDQAGDGDTAVGRYGADSGFLPRADREAATGQD